MAPLRNRKRRTTQQSTPNEKANDSNSILQALQGKNLEIIVAALLLTGKLRVDSVTLFREATLIVELTGKYKTLGSTAGIAEMIDFVRESKGKTLDEIIQSFGKQGSG